MKANFGEVLERWLEDKGISQADLARALNLRPQRISYLVKHSQCPRPEMAKTIYDYFGVNSAEFMEGPAGEFIASTRPEIKSMPKTEKQMRADIMDVVWNLHGRDLETVWSYVQGFFQGLQQGENVGRRA